MSSPQSVSHLVLAIKNLLEGEFRQVQVIGEVSNLSRSSAGHVYFTLSDSDSSLSAVIFRADTLRNPSMKALKNGDKVICSGEISVYAKRGNFQLIAKRIDMAGAGDLQAQYEKLKSSLAAQGLFDPDKKKPIPLFPRRVAVITALGGAALQDFINVYRRRAVMGQLLVVPAIVQGEQSAASLRRALNQVIKLGMADSQRQCDVIVLTRGGGSMEDLWSFNDEGLAWDIASCPIPVISAVGHQIDFTICDFVSDLRCETPTAAAERLTQGQTQVITHLARLESQLKFAANRIMNQGPMRLRACSPVTLSSLLRGRWHELSRRLRECKLDDKIEKVIGLQEKMFRLDDAARRLESNLNYVRDNFSRKLESERKLLESLNPKQVLGRGYSYITTSKGKVIASKSEWDDLKQGQSLNVNFKDGVVDVKK